MANTDAPSPLTLLPSPAATGGDLYIPFAAGDVGVVSYTSKSLTQFFGVTGVANTGITADIADATTIGINTFAYGQSSVDPDKNITVRINSVLKDFDFSDKTYYYSAGDTAKLKTLGISDATFKGKNWFYNISPTYKIESIELVDSSDKTYTITFYVDHCFRFGDSAVLISSNGNEKSTNIINIDSAKQVHSKCKFICCILR